MLFIIERIAEVREYSNIEAESLEEAMEQAGYTTGGDWSEIDRSISDISVINN